jgi:hypothetical protein
MIFQLTWADPYMVLVLDILDQGFPQDFYLKGSTKVKFPPKKT